MERYTCHQCHQVYHRYDPYKNHMAQCTTIHRRLRTKRDEYGNVAKEPAFAPRPGSDEPTQAEIDATLASIGQALGG